MFRQPQTPNRRPSISPDERHLPEGQCRYIMLHLGVEGLRCACVAFSLSSDTPGSSCDCGHMACFHLEGKQTDDKQVEALKERVQELEDQLHSERNADTRSLTLRISQLEELLDRYKADAETEVKTAFRGIEGLWSNVGILHRHMSVYDDRLEALVDSGQALHDDVRILQSKLNPIDEISMQLEDRVEALESAQLQSRHASPLPSPSPVPEEDRATISPKDHATVMAHSLNSVDAMSGAQLSQVWSVHVSLLPKSSQPMPFEQNTAAYRRCVSRGLHRIVTSFGLTSTAFQAAISQAFGDLLRGREWMPLEPRICDARALEGLPMLKQLHPSKINGPYDHNFLERHCATLDGDGKIVALYIAMRSDSFTWRELRQSAPYKDGLESCWNHDPALDGPKVEEDDLGYRDSDNERNVREDLPSAGDILQTWSPPTSRLKRNACAMSKASSFGSADGETKRSKIQQRKSNTPIQGAVRCAEAV